MTTLALETPLFLAAQAWRRHAESAAMSRIAERRLTDLVTTQGDFVARSLRNLGVFGGELDDCVQKVFMVAAKKLDDIQPGKERAFLFACARNTASHFRRSLARKREVSDDVLAESPGAQATPDVLTEQKRYRELLDRVLETMDVELREIFVLHAFEEMTMAEIAETLSIPAGTVASRLRRARLRFKEELTRLREQEIQETG
jgi:RNA polymerase sigma-70 factor (ECF subfamily)